MNRYLCLFALFGLVLSLAACSSSPDYPGMRTNAVIGAPPAPDDGYPGARGGRYAAQGAFIRTQEDERGNQSICVGQWCSCGAE